MAELSAAELDELRALVQAGDVSAIKQAVTLTTPERPKPATSATLSAKPKPTRRGLQSLKRNLTNAITVLERIQAHNRRFQEFRLEFPDVAERNRRINADPTFSRDDLSVRDWQNELVNLLGNGTLSRARQLLDELPEPTETTP